MESHALQIHVAVVNFMSRRIRGIIVQTCLQNLVFYIPSSGRYVLSIEASRGLIFQAFPIRARLVTDIGARWN